VRTNVRKGLGLVRTTTVRRGLLPAVAILALWLCGGAAQAGNILRPEPFQVAPAPGGRTASPSTGSATAADPASSSRADALSRAHDAIRTFQAAQAAARAAAAGQPGTIADGMGVGDPARGIRPGLVLDGSTPRINIGEPTVTTEADGKTDVTLVQSDQRAIVTWNSFNLSPGTKLVFDQSKGGVDVASWVVLNRVNDPSSLPSRILGSIKADGQVYVINRNGVVFGGTSQVNVGTLVASGLEILAPTPAEQLSRFQTGNLAGLSFGGPGAGIHGVQVEAGARLTANGGRIVLLGEQVVNAGTLQSDDGQVYLAAGGAITLAPSPDLAGVRGLAPPRDRVSPVDGGGLVENSGLITAARGNITLVAGRTLQDGLLTATTGAEANGSINVGGDGFTTAFGPGSVTQVLPDEGGKMVLGARTTFRQSTIDVRGILIDVQGQTATLDGARLYAPAGAINLTSVESDVNARADVADPSHDRSSVYLGTGASLDVSGLADVAVAMEQNSISAELRGNELRDNPLLRNGTLRGRTISFDGRLGGSLAGGTGAADLSGSYDVMLRDPAQLMTSGGSVALTGNTVVTRRGSVIDLSGGSLRYADGIVRRTVLIDERGNRVPIENAVPGVRYVGMDGDAVTSHARWGVTQTYAAALGGAAAHFAPGYLEGGSAGALSITTAAPYWYVDALPLVGPDMLADSNPSATGSFRVLDGGVVAQVTVGQFQRAASGSFADRTLAWRERPAPARLTLDKAGDITFKSGGPILLDGYVAGDPLKEELRYQHVLPLGWFDGQTFGSVTISSGFDGRNQTNGANSAPGGHLTLGEGQVVNLGDAGSFTFKGTSAEIAGTILAPGGKVSLSATQRESASDTAPTIHLGATGFIDVAGRFTNDALDGAAGPLRPIDGGSVSLVGGRVLLDAGSLIDASGGGQLDATGTRLTRGKGGAISLDVSRYPVGEDASLFTSAYRGVLRLDGTLEGHALGRGGSLTIRTGWDVVIGDALDPGQGLFNAAFFTRGGFSAYTIVGGSSLTVKAGTLIAPVTESLAPPEFLGEVATGSVLRNLMGVTVFDDLSLRPAASLTLGVRAEAGPTTLTIEGATINEPAAEIHLDPGGSLTLNATGTIDVGGTLEADGGKISLIASGTSTVNGTITLGPRARLLVPGWLAQTVVANQSIASVLPGGSATISAGTVTLAPTAVIDASGVSGPVDLPAGDGSARGVKGGRIQVDGSGGQIAITAGDSSVIGGDLRLGPGGGATSTGAGGSLVLTNGTGNIVVTQHQPAAGAGAVLTVVADSVNGSLADDVTLVAVSPASPPLTGNVNGILFDGKVDLLAGRSLRLVSPLLAQRIGTTGDVFLSAPSVTLDGLPAGTDLSGSDVAAAGGSLTVKADVIDVSRTVVLGGSIGASTPFASTTFNAAQDIRLSDYDRDGNLATRSGLLAAGSLTLNAAQVYVTSRAAGAAGDLTWTDADPGFLVSSMQQVTIKRNGHPAPVPLSFGGRLTLRAPIIDQGGVLRAPGGEIRLEGRDPSGAVTPSVTLQDGSLTSTSLEGALVPFGATLSGGLFPGYGSPGQAPAHGVKLDAVNVSIKKDAIIDATGGGDLQGYQFSPGNGGSTEVLSPRVGASGGVVLDAGGNPLSARSIAFGKDLPAPFAIVPSLGTQVAPVARSSDLRDGRLKVGDQVWLQGVPGLAAGYYTLLPAHYALLPGGMLVLPLPGAWAAAPAPFIRADGAVVASGHSSHVVYDASGAERRVDDPRYGQFVVLPRGVYSQYSSITDYSFDQVARSLASEAGLPVRTLADGGTAVFQAQQMELLGKGLFAGGQHDDGTAGLLGNLDIAAPAIAIVANGAAAPGAGFLTIDAGALEAFGAGSILVGGTRSLSKDANLPGTVINTAAARGGALQVVVNLAGGTWTGPEILLAARQGVTVADGSTLKASGAGAVDSGRLILAGDGALLRLSAGGRVGLVRTGTPAASVGLLDVGNATLDAGGGSLALEAAGRVSMGATVSLSGKQLDLASSDIHLGASAPAGAAGTWLSSALITRLAASSDLLIRGHDAIHLHGNLDLGSRTGGTASMPAFALDTPLLQEEGNGTTRITAGRLTLQNSGLVGGAGAAGAGTLSLDVDQLVAGPGPVQVAGLSTLQGRAGTMRLSGRLDLGAAQVQLQTAQVTGTSGGDGSITTRGALALTGDAIGVASAPGTTGGYLTLQGSSVELDTTITLPGGSLLATATGGALALGDHARLEVAGAAIDFHGTVKVAPGGSVVLTAAGDVTASVTSAIDVSAAAGGDAGTLAVTAGGSATLAGSLSGAAASDQRGGGFSLVARDVPSFSALNGLLEEGGFTASRQVRLQQDIVLAAGERITARQVELRSDTGAVRVDGTIDAASKGAWDADGGQIRLVGETGVLVGGHLDASAYGGTLPDGAFQPASGTVELVTGAGQVKVDPGARIDLSGGRSGGGLLVARAPRLVADVGIGLAGQVVGAREVRVQGSADYAATTVDAPLAASMVNEGAAWLNNASAIIARLVKANLTLAPLLTVGAAAEVTSAGDLTLASDILVNGRLGAGHLGFSAAGNIVVGANVSDGFADALVPAGGSVRQASLNSGPSSSLAFEAGGSVTVGAAGSPVLVRTGSGDIAVRAGRGDIVLADPASVIYTAGRKTDLAPGFGGVGGAALPHRLDGTLAPMGEFPIAGGDVELRAGRDVISQIATQSSSAWLYRYGATSWDGKAWKVAQQTSWSIVYANFEQGVGALGGGDVFVSAGRDVRQLQVALPTTGQLTTAKDQVAQPTDLVVRGGGDLDVRAGHDLVGGLFTMGEGRATLHAGGDVTRSTLPADLRNLRVGAGSPATTAPGQVAPLLGLADAQATITAGGSVAIQGAFDLMRQPVIAANLVDGTGSGFWGYTGRTALTAFAVGGTTSYDGDPYASLDLSLKGKYPVLLSSVSGPDGYHGLFGIAPPTLRLVSGGGSILRSARFPGAPLVLAAAARGNLELLALGDVRLPPTIILEDTAAAFNRGPLAPVTTTGTDGALRYDQKNFDNSRGETPLHAGDPDPVLIVALNGSICAQVGGSCVRSPPPPYGQASTMAVLSIPKPIQAYAGRDILAGYWKPQHNTPADLSVLSAGRDIYQPVIEVTGQGSMLVEAGRDVIFGETAVTLSRIVSPPREGGAIFGLGNLTSAGTLLSPPLPRDRGADFYILAGAATGRVDWDAFAAAYLGTGGAGAPKVVRTYLTELADFMKGLDKARYGALSGAGLVAAFEALAPESRRPFLEKVLFTELKETGIDYNDPKSPRFKSYNRGFEAVHLLFPVDPASLADRSRGNVILHGKPVETELAGGITIMAPYGRVEVGTDLPQVFVDPSLGGVVTRRGGDIRIMADQDISLMSSRVFTLQGGDITMWTTDGSITAGVGSKTSVSRPPLRYLLSSTGAVLVDAFGLSTGAGIGVLDALQTAGGRPPSRLDIIAPRGEVNAGDAGIRVVGNINIAAAVVVGVENIQVSGASTGVPKVEAPNIGSLTTASSVAQAAAQQGVGPAAQARNSMADLPSIITVEVLGYETATPPGDPDPRKKKK
jgi:filamentous hemagglutinin family protein